MKLDSEAVFERQNGFGGRTSPNSSIRRQPGRQLVDSVADFCLRIEPPLDCCYVMVMTPCYHAVRKPHLLDTQGLYSYSGLKPRLRVARAIVTAAGYRAASESTMGTEVYLAATESILALENCLRIRFFSLLNQVSLKI